MSRVNTQGRARNDRRVFLPAPRTVSADPVSCTGSRGTGVGAGCCTARQRSRLGRIVPTSAGGVMSGSGASSPELLPMLSRGKHRNIRKGACFMEMASLLAGERWSDHPKCTHPLLAETARLINDCTSDEQRHRLAVLIPSVVGLKGDDVRIDARIAHRCAIVALPIASAERQNTLAVSVLTADHVLATLDGRAPGTLAEGSREALDAVPRAAQWGYDFIRRAGVSVKGFRRHAGPTIVRLAGDRGGVRARSGRHPPATPERPHRRLRATVRSGANTDRRGGTGGSGPRRGHGRRQRLTYADWAGHTA